MFLQYYTYNWDDIFITNINHVKPNKDGNLLKSIANAYYPERQKMNELTEKITMVVTTNSYCKSVIISGTILYSWDYYNHIVKSTIIILYYIFLVYIAIKNSCPLREI